MVCYLAKISSFFQVFHEIKLQVFLLNSMFMTSCYLILYFTVTREESVYDCEEQEPQLKYCGLQSDSLVMCDPRIKKFKS